ncbi:MAG: extradiol dioxygenase [Candidatus Eremiobacteraeota bacterium]|nr:extradiol dioxygenase [Candidatus Eremiobacteraeota bacterium]
MITGMHVILFSRHAEKVREFLADVLQLRSVDAGEGWPVFAAPPTEIAVHPAEEAPEHEVYLMCDDVNGVVAQLAERGIQTDGPVEDRNWGRSTTIILPGGERIGLYEPRHPSPLGARSGR